jgi:hypothetical protein
MRIRIRDLVNPGSGIRDRKSRIRDKHPESAVDTPFSKMCVADVNQKNNM